MNRISYTDSPLDGLYVEDVLFYLRKRGWKRKEHPKDRLLLFTGPEDDDGQPIVIGVPQRNNFLDSKAGLAEAVTCCQSQYYEAVSQDWGLICP